MTVVPIGVPVPPGGLDPDVALPGTSSPASSGSDFARELSGVLNGASAQLQKADTAERAFVSGGGSLQAMVIERAQADVALSIATSAASRVTQSLSTILGMQV